MRKDRHSYEYTRKFQKENYEMVNLRIRKDSGVLERVRILAKKKNITVSEYIRQAIENQLNAEK